MTRAHSQQKTITELAYYPDHVDRESSDEYEHNHDRLVHTLKLPCWVCGRTWSDARDDGMWLETHHIIEWAEFNAVDAESFADLYDPTADGLTLDPYGYADQLMDSGKADSPDHICNLLVLCSECHRYRENGIHETTGPIWLANALTADGRGILHGDTGE